MYYTARPKPNTNFRPWDEMMVEELRHDAGPEFPRNNKLTDRDKICFTCPLPECTPLTGDCPLKERGQPIRWDRIAKQLEG